MIDSRQQRILLDRRFSRRLCSAPSVAICFHNGASIKLHWRHTYGQRKRRLYSSKGWSYRCQPLDTTEIVASREHLSIYTLHGQPLFFQHFDGPFIPTLKLLHKCKLLPSLPPITDGFIVPKIVPSLRVDRGAIRFLLAGANMMCPGFTSKGGSLPGPEGALAAGAVVAIETEAKEHAAALGILKISTEEIKSVNKGVAVEIMCYLGDDLWNVETI